MDIFSVFTLLGGLALFLYGMTVMSQGLEKIAGGKLETILRQMTSNPTKSLFFGIVITVAVQSSSAVTVMLVGLVNSGIMELSSTVGIIMGSNIGTTITAWILSLAGISSDNVFIRLIKPESFSPVLALIGVIMMMTGKTSKKKDIGSILVGFAVLMFGMEFMKNSVEPLSDMPQFTSILTAFNNPLLGILTGLVITAVIQSSAASVGMLQALSMTGGITYSMAVPIIMGQNIGTCITAVISSIGVSRNAKRVAVIHIAFNVTGTVICMIIFFALHSMSAFSFLDGRISPVGIALVHSIFNVTTTALLLPFTKVLVKIAEKAIKVERVPEEAVLLDDRLLNTPSIALSECNEKTTEMAYESKNTIFSAMESVFGYTPELEISVNEMEKRVDYYEDKLGSFLVKLSGQELSDNDTRQISKLLHTIGDFERISDHGVNLMKAGREIHDKEIEFSGAALEEINLLSEAVKEILDITIKAFDDDDLDLAGRVEPLEQVIDVMVEKIKTNHVGRLQKGMCTIEHGFVLSDIVTNYERVSDHCSNIAVALLELSKDSFGTHEYLNKIKTMDNPQFKEAFSYYETKYTVKK